MKKLSFFFAVCGFTLLASNNVAFAQSTPPPVNTGCADSDINCWENAGFIQGRGYASSHSMAESAAEGNRATEYAEYYRNQPYSPRNNALNHYWNAYADGISFYNGGY